MRPDALFRCSGAAALAASCLLLAPAASRAETFTIADGETVGTQQTLDIGETGLIQAGGILDTGTDPAVLMPGTAASLRNAGSIRTMGAAAAGVSASGDEVVISNSGLIGTGGFAAAGMSSSGANASLANLGRITTSGVGASAIESLGADAQIANSGRLAASGFAGTGITSFGSSAIIVNSGQIAASGIEGLGISSGGAAASIINRGSIVASGPFGRGILLIGADDATMVSNAGLIAATGQESYAILGDAGDTTLNLLPDSRILGRVDLGDGSDTVNILGASRVSATLTLAGVEQVNLNGAPGVVVGDRITLVDPTGSAIQGTLISRLASSVHQSLPWHGTRPQAVLLAAQTDDPAIYPAASAGAGWARLFGGSHRRGNDGSIAAHEHDYLGFLAGFERDFGRHRLGLFGGAARTDTDTARHSYSSEGEAYFIGGYGRWQFEETEIGASLAAGLTDHDNARLVLDNLNGSERARADVDGQFVSPSLTLAWQHDISRRIALRPSASLVYTLARQESYRESGTSQSNLRVAQRTLRILEARVQLAALISLPRQGELELRAGISSRHGNDDAVHTSLAGNAFRYSVDGDDHVLGGLLGTRLRLPLTSQIDLVADAEYGRAESDEREWGVSAMLHYAY